MFIKNSDERAAFLKSVSVDAYKRLIAPSIENEIRSDLTEKAQDQAIKVFEKNLQQLLMAQPIAGKTVLVTGGGGSIGSELCRQVASVNGLERLIIFDIYENNAHAIKLELMDILKGEYYAPHVSIWYYRLDSIDEVNQPEMWIKANPNLGKTVQYETYQLDVERAEKYSVVRSQHSRLPQLGRAARTTRKNKGEGGYQPGTRHPDNDRREGKGPCGNKDVRGAFRLG